MRSKVYQDFYHYIVYIANEDRHIAHTPQTFILRKVSRLQRGNQQQSKADNTIGERKQEQIDRQQNTTQGYEFHYKWGTNSGAPESPVLLVASVL